MQRSETAFEAAFRRAGLGNDSLAYTVAGEVFKLADGDQARFCKLFWERLNANPDLRVAALSLFHRVVQEDMQGTGYCDGADKATGHVPAPLHDEMPGGGQSIRADEADMPVPPARQQNGGAAGSRGSAENGSSGISRPSPNSREAGASCSAPKGSAPRSPAREPTAAAKRAAKAVARVEAQTVLDRFKLTERNGAKTVIGDISIARLDSLGFYAAKREFVAGHERHLVALMRKEIARFPHVPKEARVRDILDAETVERLIQEAKELAMPVKALPSDWMEAANV